MAIESRTRITIETERILVVAGQRAIRGWCKRCRQEVEFVAQDQLAPLLRTSPEQPARWSQNKVHLQQAKDGLAICMKSLLRLARGNHD